MVVELAAAHRFARALDREDYLAALDCLTPDCVYEIGDTTVRGAAEIVESYRVNGAWAAEHFDRIRYESDVRVLDGDTAVVTFVDHVVHAARSLTHRCEQRLELDARGQIARIVHIDMPGERESLERFLDQVGLRE